MILNVPAWKSVVPFAVLLAGVDFFALTRWKVPLITVVVVSGTAGLLQAIAGA
jgi:hypothetical protein